MAREPAKRARKQRGAKPAARESAATRAASGPAPEREDARGPKTTRPRASARRAARPTTPGGGGATPGAMASDAEKRIGRPLDAVPDRLDLRDWVYQPDLAPLPDVLVNCPWAHGDDILDQGQEGACTGFALAAVIHHLLRHRNLRRRVSPRMLYEMARRYDEWPGEGYDGSSARGAMKGWVAHGVCRTEAWPANVHGPGHLTPQVAADALGTPGGAYYRVTHRNVRDLHSAINQTGAVYATLMVHEGWAPDFLAAKDAPRATVYYSDSGNASKLELPVITRRGRADAGHAIALVGYNREGFIVQNSWGPAWGAGGFALLPYEDWLLHSTDAWVAQLGVPVALDLWQAGQAYADTTAGLHRATATVPLADIRPFAIDVGNNGRLSDSGDYWTTPEDLRRLFTDYIPAASREWEKKRVMLYLHGGLNSEADAAKRIVAFRDVFLANRIYPVHIMWETGVMESLRGILRDLLGDQRAGGIREWFGKLREGLSEAKDRSIELTTAWAGRKLWGEMKENGTAASESPDGGFRLLVNQAKTALKAAGGDASNWELHVVGHSAGSIFAAHAMPLLCSLGVNFKSLQLMAPAVRIDDFKQLVVPFLNNGCPDPVVYMLSDQGELDDTVGPYGKSLLYLVSNAFEGKWGVPLLGMQKYFGSNSDLQPLFPPGNVVVAGAAPPGTEDRAKDDPPLYATVSRSNSHGGFDNDRATMNGVLYRILGRAPDREFSNRDLAY